MAVSGIPGTVFLLNNEIILPTSHQCKQWLKPLQEINFVFRLSYLNLPK